MKKIIILIVFCFFSFLNYWVIYAWSAVSTEDNILFDAFAERRDRLLELAWWGRLEIEINVLRNSLETLDVENQLSTDVKEKILEDISTLEENIEQINEDILENIENWDEFDTLVDKYLNEIQLKRELVTELNNAIQENELNQEKITILLDRYLDEREQLQEQNNIEQNIKFYIVLIFTFLSIAIYVITFYLAKKWKIDNKKWVYINFFLLFSYIIFLIWFFFYLYPELSIFLIFISWYLLVINSHLIWSFIWSVIVLERFKIWEIIKFQEIEWQVIKINPLYIILMPLTKEWLFINKPVYIPHINILKESVVKDITPWNYIHNFEVTIRDEWSLDVMRFIEWVEQNILTKFLSSRLSSLNWINDTFRTSFQRTQVWHLVVVFTWKWDDILNKKLERKIIWYLFRIVNDSKKNKELEEKQKNEKHEIDDNNKEAN